MPKPRELCQWKTCKNKGKLYPGKSDWTLLCRLHVAPYLREKAKGT